MNNLWQSLVPSTFRKHYFRSNNESYESSDTEDPDVDFKQLVNQAKEEETEDWGLPPDLRRMVEQEERDTGLIGFLGGTGFVGDLEEGKEGVLFSCGDYPNVPLIGTRGCINYNPALAIRQLGYPMRGAPTEESLSPFLVMDLGVQKLKCF